MVHVVSVAHHHQLAICCGGRSGVLLAVLTRCAGRCKARGVRTPWHAILCESTYIRSQDGMDGLCLGRAVSRRSRTTETGNMARALCRDWLCGKLVYLDDPLSKRCCELARMMMPKQVNRRHGRGRHTQRRNLLTPAARSHESVSSFSPPAMHAFPRIPTNTNDP